jgi:hypothetical protein
MAGTCLDGRDGRITTFSSDSGPRFSGFGPETCTAGLAVWCEEPLPPGTVFTRWLTGQRQGRGVVTGTPPDPT